MSVDWSPIGAIWPSIPGVVDRHVDPSEPRDGLVYKTANFGFEAHVGIQKLCIHAKRTQFRGQGVSSLFATAFDDQSDTLLGEGNGGSTADARERDGMIHINTPYGRKYVVDHSVTMWIYIVRTRPFDSLAGTDKSYIFTTVYR